MPDDTYRAQVAPQRGTGTLPFARPETYGAGVADALMQGSQVLGQMAVQDRALETQRNRDFQATAAALEFAQIQQELDEFALQTQEEVDAGGSGYRQLIEARIAERQTSFLAGIADDRVRQQYAARFAAWSGEALVTAEAWQRGRAAGQVVTNHRETVNIRANRATRADQVGFTREIAEHRADVAALEHVPANIREALDREGVAQISASWIGSRPPAERFVLLDSGLFDQLDPGVIEQLRSQAEVDQRRAAVEAEAQARARQAEVTSVVDELLDDYRAGVPRSEADLTEGYNMAVEAGLDDDARDLRGAIMGNRALQAYERATPPQIDAEIIRLNQQLRETEDVDQQRDIVAQRDALTGLRDRRQAQLTDNPSAFAADLGVDWPELDFGDPATVAARRRAAQSLSEATGTPAQYLTAAEVGQLRANVGSLDGQRAVLDLARAFGGQAGAAVIRQVDSDDYLLLHAVSLNDDYAARALQGRDLLARDVVSIPSDFDQRYAEFVGGAFTDMSAAAQGGRRDAARSLYAYYAQRHGLSREQTDVEWLRTAVQHAVNRRAPQGGLTTWEGYRVELPQNMTAESFDRRLANIRNTTGFWSDGETPVTGRQLREDFYPVRQGNGFYAFRRRGGNTYVLNDRGGRWMADIATIAPLAAQAQEPPAPRRAQPNYRIGGDPAPVDPNRPQPNYRIGGSD